VAAELFIIIAGVGVCLATAGWMAHRLSLPPALGYLAVGMAFAPSVRLTPDLPASAIATTAHVGVLFVLFFIGLELDLRTLRKVMGDTAWVSLFDILVPAAVVFAIGPARSGARSRHSCAATATRSSAGIARPCRSIATTPWTGSWPRPPPTPS
jgi:Kef-type K+ transport system membrane component KefB